MKSKCVCGKVKSKYMNLCRKCHEKRRSGILAENMAIAAVGICPDCKGNLKRNIALAGWWQCESFATACSFQMFTE